MTHPALWLGQDRIVLASGSAARRQLLDGAGIPFDIIKPNVDEKAIAATLLEERASPREIAIALAHAKAEAVARKVPNRLVLAADQTLDHAGTLFMKPVDYASARGQLQRLRDSEHRLHSAAVLRRDSAVLWAGHSTAALTMRDFSNGFLDAYLAAMGDAVLETVGGYQLEALGPHLFSDIVGDHPTILGLPLFGLLWALRDLGLLRS
jgi:septum formation protein